MLKRFTPEQFAASAAAGEPRSEQFFSGDSGAWHAYQESFYSTLLSEMLPPAGDGRRAGCWKRARRQRGKIEAQREKKAADVALVTDENDVTNESQQQLHKRLKVSEHWRSEHAASILELRTSTPRASPSGKHAVRELRAVVATPGGVNSRECCAEVRYDLLPAEGESEEAAKQRDVIMIGIGGVSSSRSGVWPGCPSRRSRSGARRRRRKRRGWSGWRRWCATAISFF